MLDAAGGEQDLVSGMRADREMDVVLASAERGGACG